MDLHAARQQCRAHHPASRPAPSGRRPASRHVPRVLAGLAVLALLALLAPSVGHYLFAVAWLTACAATYHHHTKGPQ